MIVFAAVTDFLDGFLARRWQVNSAFGEALDPIADKALLSGAFVALWLAGSIEGWLTGVVLGRDALILLFAGVVIISKERRRFPPSQLGKISTGMQIALVIAIAMQVPATIIEVLKWATVALAAGSGLDYARLAYNRR